MPLLVSWLLLFGNAQVSGWEIFADTRFKIEYSEAFGMDAEVPIFDEKVKALEGTSIELTGYYLPFDMEKDRIIISKLPYSSCFFCGGGGGPESVAEVVFNAVQRPLRLDEIITVKGILKLNVDDYDHLVFLVEDAKIIE